MIYRNTLDLLGHPIKVYLVSAEDIRRLSGCTEDDATPEGYCDIEQARIFMQENLAPCRMRDTLLHEVGHYFIDVSGLKKFFLSSVKTDDYCEWEENLIAHCIPDLLTVVTENGTSLLYPLNELSGAV